jgi:hypothetical protein
MRASPQSLRQLFSAVLLVAGIISLGGLWGVSQVPRKEVEVEESSWMMLAERLDDFPVVLEALSVHLEMTALVLGTAEGGTFETRHNHLGAGHILATVAHNLHILGFCCW